MFSLFFFNIFIGLDTMQPNKSDLQGNTAKQLSKSLYSMLLLCQIVSQLSYLPPTVSNDVWQHKGMSFMCSGILYMIIRSSKF